MSMHRPLIFEPERYALLNTMVEATYREAVRRGLFLSANEQEARVILARRMIRAIEAGEIDSDKLHALALQDDESPWITDADLLCESFH